MLKITDAGIEGVPVDRIGLVKSRPLIGKLALRFTRWRRAVNAERYMEGGDQHLDIGCGEGYFLMRSPYKVRYGLDLLMGDGEEITNRIDFPDDSLDLVTMLAVIEHMANPLPVLEDIRRVLKPGGRLILTTPKRASEWILNLYVHDIQDEHETYYTLESMRRLTDGLFEFIGYHTFILGLNQAFCLAKPAE